MSDLHGFKPPVEHGLKADLSIISGDLNIDVCKGFLAKKFPYMQADWCHSNMVPYFDRLPSKRVFVTLGNHDFCGTPEAPLRNSAKTKFLIDKMVDFKGLRIWGSPWTLQFMDWAWMKEPEAYTVYLEHLPLGIDILISHQPPYIAGKPYGSVELLNWIFTHQPKLVVCGHIHTMRGTYTIGNTQVVCCPMVDEEYKQVYEPIIVDI